MKHDRAYGEKRGIGKKRKHCDMGVWRLNRIKTFQFFLEILKKRRKNLTTRCTFESSLSCKHELVI